jgi:hypothetical protein
MSDKFAMNGLESRVSSTPTCAALRDMLVFKFQVSSVGAFSRFGLGRPVTRKGRTPCLLHSGATVSRGYDF